MFNGSQFFSLLRTYYNANEIEYIHILKIIMNYYFDSQYMRIPKLIKFPENYNIRSIKTVMTEVGYSVTSITCSEGSIIAEFKKNL